MTEYMSTDRDSLTLREIAARSPRHAVALERIARQLSGTDDEGLVPGWMLTEHGDPRPGFEWLDCDDAA